MIEVNFDLGMDRYTTGLLHGFVVGFVVCNLVWVIGCLVW